MPEKTFTVWTCSRCGHTEEMNGRDQPEDWTRVLELSPPRSNPIEAESLSDLCSMCAGAFSYFLRNMAVSAVDL